MLLVWGISRAVIRGIYSHYLANGLWMAWPLLSPFHRDPVKRLERKLTRKSDEEEEADVDNILSRFVISAFVRGFAAHTVMDGWDSAFRETWFFAGKSVAAVVKVGVRRAVVRYRKRQKRQRGGDG